MTLHIIQEEEDGIPQEPLVFPTIEQAGLQMQKLAVSIGLKPKPERQGWDVYLLDTPFDMFEIDECYGARYWEVEYNNEQTQRS